MTLYKFIPANEYDGEENNKKSIEIKEFLLRELGLWLQIFV